MLKMLFVQCMDREYTSCVYNFKTLCLFAVELVWVGQL